MFGFYDAESGCHPRHSHRPPFLWALLTDPVARQPGFRPALKDIDRIFLMALGSNTAYQFYFMRAFYPIQLLVVAVGSAIVPYLRLLAPAWRNRARLAESVNCSTASAA